MNKWGNLIGVIALLFGSSASAETIVGGSIESEITMEFSDNEYEVRQLRNGVNFNVRSDLSAQVSSFFQAKLYGDIRGNLTSEDMNSVDQIIPWNAELDEAYFDVYGFLLPDLDIRIGKQRIAWGTADVLNPTDNLNPDNFSNLLDFGQKMAVTSLLFDYYFDIFNVSLVLIPIMTPSVLPATDYGNLFGAMLEPMGFTTLDVHENFMIPDFGLENVMAALKVSVLNVLGFDISVSDFWGFDDVPAMTGLSITPTGPTSATVDYTIDYPRVNVVGMDFIGSLGPVGLWGEGALFVPIDFQYLTFSNSLDPAETAVLDPYFKGTVGMDYYLGDIYLNLQYNYGFFDEKGSDLTHLALLSTQYKTGNGKIQLTLTGGAELDYGNLDSFLPSWIVSPQLLYKPYDATEFLLGVVWVDGEDNSKFGVMKTFSGLLTFKYTF